MYVGRCRVAVNWTEEEVAQASAKLRLNGQDESS